MLIGNLRLSIISFELTYYLYLFLCETQNNASPNKFLLRNSESVNNE